MQYLARFNCKKHTKQSHCLVVNSRPTSHEIPFIFRNLKKLWPSSQQTATDPYITQTNSVHIGTHYFRKIDISNILPPTHSFPRGFLLLGFTKKKNILCLPDPSYWCYISHQYHPSSVCDNK